ncbi:hypothetical protein [Prescottella equi]|uniref:hypothetical protein n=1 Tax=Rhodococcus hoagii TaxID=43767 RepID=UPI00131AC95D|nr:hypothetical protein [Prescottella equi]
MAWDFQDVLLGAAEAEVPRLERELQDKFAALRKCTTPDAVERVARELRRVADGLATAHTHRVTAAAHIAARDGA